MALRFPETAPAVEKHGTADLQFAQQMCPLDADLARGRRDRRDRPQRTDLAAIERVAARSRLGVDRRQIGIDRQARGGVRLEALELRVVLVAAGFIAKHGPGHQGFAPQSDQTSRVQVPGDARSPVACAGA